MTFLQLWGGLAIFILCPILGGLPLIGWLVQGLTGKRLSQLGTGNVSVSAAFYHGGRWVGILAVVTEALKGIGAVLMARYFFPTDPTWEIVALIALVMGRYSIGRGAGATNVLYGFWVHDWVVTSLGLLISGISFTIWRERRQGRLVVLMVFPIMMLLIHPEQGSRLGATVILSLLLAWIFENMPDDLDLPAEEGNVAVQKEFRFFRGDRALRTLDQKLSSDQVGQKAATLSELKRLGYPVPMGWVLPAGDDPYPLLAAAQPSPQMPLVVRSSAIGEDSEGASAAGLYQSILDVTGPDELADAISRCFASYNRAAAIQYRQDQQVESAAMAVLVQRQVKGVYSGVAFSRDPIARQGDTVVIEALEGATAQVVSGQVTPEQYQVHVPNLDQSVVSASKHQLQDWTLPANLTLALEGNGNVPPQLIQQVAYLARHLEDFYHGIPQDIEWTYDGHQLWLLQARPITTLLPIWTRKIAAEVIPGFIRPLTWSINRPLTCGVWGQIFTIVLGKRAQGMDFSETATLHNSAAYFNASLLGQIFRRMGLPAESLEFLTRGAKFSRPPLTATLRNIPGLLKLVGKSELDLEQDFQQEDRHQFVPALAHFNQQPVQELSAPAALNRVEQLLQLLERATYYSILAPLSFALRQALFKVKDEALDSRESPEVACLQDLKKLAEQGRSQLPDLDANLESSQLLNRLRADEQGQLILSGLDQFLNRYGYLSEVGTDIAIPTWKEDPKPVYDLFTQFVLNPPPAKTAPRRSRSWKTKRVQRRLDLKGRVTAVYSRLLAELRWSFMAIAHHWHSEQLLSHPEEIFFLELDEIRQLVKNLDTDLKVQVTPLIAMRRSQLERDRQITPVPALVYGNTPPPTLARTPPAATGQSIQRLQGIGASPGRVEGRVKIMLNIQSADDLTADTILVVPYTDSGWVPVLVRCAGLIAEVGGRLSHGAIVAREYGIPAVMDITHATHQLREGQPVRIDGTAGTVEILVEDN